jgi:hypothetical protein
MACLKRSGSYLPVVIDWLAQETVKIRLGKWKDKIDTIPKPVSLDKLDNMVVSVSVGVLKILLLQVGGKLFCFNPFSCELFDLLGVLGASSDFQVAGIMERH